MFNNYEINISPAELVILIGLVVNSLLTIVGWDKEREARQQELLTPRRIELIKEIQSWVDEGLEAAMELRTVSRVDNNIKSLAPENYTYLLTYRTIRYGDWSIKIVKMKAISRTIDAELEKLIEEYHLNADHVAKSLEDNNEKQAWLAQRAIDIYSNLEEHVEIK